jgi:integrase
LHQSLRQPFAQPRPPARGLRLADHDVGGVALANDPGYRGDQVVVLLNQEGGPQHRGEPAQRAHLILQLALDRFARRLDPEQVEAGPQRCAERHARRTRRWELGCGRTSASSRSPTAFGASAATLSSSRRVPTASTSLYSWAGFHTFRHTFASLHLSRGTNIVQLSRALGHHSPAFTLTRYTHLLPGDEAPALDLDLEPHGFDGAVAVGAERLAAAI